MDKIKRAIEEAKNSGIMTDKELKPIKVAIDNKDSLLSPETLNAFVHGSWMNPDPLRLKLEWLNAQIFIERLWRVINGTGQI